MELLSLAEATHFNTKQLHCDSKLYNDHTSTLQRRRSEKRQRIATENERGGTVKAITI